MEQSRTWSTDPTESDSCEVRSVRLQKDISKARLFQEMCDLLKPLTAMIGPAKRFWKQLDSVTSWEKLELLCAQYITQHPRAVEDNVATLSATVDAGSSSEVEPVQAHADNPQGHSNPEPLAPAFDQLDGPAAKADPLVQEEVGTGSPTKKKVQSDPTPSQPVRGSSDGQSPVEVFLFARECGHPQPENVPYRKVPDVNPPGACVPSASLASVKAAAKPNPSPSTSEP